MNRKEKLLTTAGILAAALIVVQNFAEHFIENTSSTDLDARRDSAHGLG